MDAISNVIVIGVILFGFFQFFGVMIVMYIWSLFEYLAKRADIMASWGVSFQIGQRKLSIASEIQTRLNDSDCASASNHLLYLRSFAHDRSLQVGQFDFETLMAYTLSQVNPIVAVGYDGDKIGPIGVESSDADWKRTVAELVDGASAIVLIPSDSDGVRWEISLLRERRFLEKTVFVAPPSFSLPKFATNRWDRMRTHPALQMLEIPPYCIRGFVFMLHEDGSLKSAGPLGLDVSPLLIDLKIQEKLEKKSNSWKKAASQGDVSRDDQGQVPTPKNFSDAAYADIDHIMCTTSVMFASNLEILERHASVDCNIVDSHSDQNAESSGGNEVTSFFGGGNGDGTSGGG